MSINVLFLCTGNSARSILAEVMINQVITQPGVKAYSAGSKPNGEVNPGALEELKKRGYSNVGLSSKSWDQFSNTQSPSIDWVITLCDVYHTSIVIFLTMFVAGLGFVVMIRTP